MRTIGLAAVLALTALASIGVGSASANEETVLCKANVEVCTGENYIGYAFNTIGTTVKFKLGEVTTVQCTGTMERSKTEMLTSLSFSSCTGGCTVTASGLPVYADLHEPVAGSGKLSLVAPDLAFSCGGNECVYGQTKTSDFPVEGGKPGVINVNKSLFEKTGNILCQASALWEAKYTIKTSPAYVSTRGVSGPMFCTANETPCKAEARRMEEEFSLAPKAEVTFGTFVNASQIKCSEAKFRLKNYNIYVPGGEWLYEPLALSNCTSPVYTACTVTNDNAPYPSSLKASGGGNGTITVGEPSAGATVLTIQCSLSGIKFTCTYKRSSTTSFSIGFSGGSPASLSASDSFTKLTGPGGGICPTTAGMTGTFQSTTKPLYLVSS